MIMESTGVCWKPVFPILEDQFAVWLVNAHQIKQVRGRTTVLIAHRLQTAMGADRIVVLDGGRVVEQGRHRDLVAAGGRYAELWEAYAIEVPIEAQTA